MQKEKVATTKTRLQALVTSTPAAGDKSLLLQSVALFETLLAKIHALQDENEAMKGRRADADDYGHAVLELESTRKELREANQVRSRHCALRGIMTLDSFRSSIHTRRRTARCPPSCPHLKRHSEEQNCTSAHTTELQSRKEADLKRQLAEAKARLDSAMVGRQSESEMYEEAILKAAGLEKSAVEINAQVKEWDEFKTV